MLKIPTHLITAASSWLSKIIIAGVQLLSVKYLLEMLGENNYAIFSLLTGLMIWCTLIDFGIGSSLQNFISELRAKNEDYNSYIKAALRLLFVAAVAFIGIMVLLSKLISEFYLASFSETLKGHESFVFVSAIIVFGLVGVGAVGYKILFAELIGWKANVINGVSYLLGLICVLVLYFLQIKIDVVLALLALYAPVALLSMFYIVYRYFKLVAVMPGKQYYLDILKRTYGFFIFTLLSILVLQADYIVISQKLSPADIVKYTITMKIFGLVFFIYTAVLQALWPICAEYRIRKEWIKLKKTVAVNIAVGIVFIIVSTIVIYLCKKTIYGILSPELDTNISIYIFILLAVYFSTRVWCDTFAMLLQSMNSLKVLWFFVPCQAVISGWAQWVLAGKYGILGVLIGLTLSFLLTVFWGLPVTYFKVVNKESVK
ncbi:MATE family efflux transporter [Kosakonia sp.]|uniref:MATE family efflux transporter n=1 Tax=Kosakonia sp. TaxID=1916651 RepID=UPI002899B0EE|nr:MATE family efflux transporter [Kosakonia sp.]